MKKVYCLLGCCALFVCLGSMNQFRQVNVKEASAVVGYGLPLCDKAVVELSCANNGDPFCEAVPDPSLPICTGDKSCGVVCDGTNTKTRINTHPGIGDPSGVWVIHGDDHEEVDIECGAENEYASDCFWQAPPAPNPYNLPPFCACSGTTVPNGEVCLVKEDQATVECEEGIIAIYRSKLPHESEAFSIAKNMLLATLAN